jgi:hypothetical protein
MNIPKPTPAQLEGIARMAKEGIKALPGDVPNITPWRWRGGKPGEVTGSKISEIEKDISFVNMHGTSRGMKGKLKAERSKALKKAVNQIESHIKKNPDSAVGNVYDSLVIRGINPQKRADIILKTVYLPLEKAGIPRDWTGKVAAATAYKGIDPRRLSAELETLDDLGREELLRSIVEGTYL